MKQAKRHITGDDLFEALCLLQTLAAIGANGIFQSDLGGLRMRDGMIVQMDGQVIRDLAAGDKASWSWRKVRGKPNGTLNADLTTLLLGTIS